MSTKQSLTSIGQPVPELPVTDVERAQQYYRDALGFEIGWLNPGKEIGAVSREYVAVFLRKKTPPFEPAVHWVFAEELQHHHQAENYYTVVTRAKTSLDVYIGTALPGLLAKAHSDSDGSIWGGS